MSNQPVCLLHIGKTGGSFLKSIIAHNQRSKGSTRAVRPLRHAETVVTTAEKFGHDRQLAFVVRDPIERFHSAFYSRRRNGRPKSRVLWSPAEASAYLWFAEAEDLALALGSSDPRLYSAAEYAMASIQHLRLNYQHFLHSPQRLRSEHAAGRIVACPDLADLDHSLDAFMAAIGLSDYELPDTVTRHANPPAPHLSAEAKQNLTRYWAAEFALYETCREISAELSRS